MKDPFIQNQITQFKMNVNIVIFSYIKYSIYYSNLNINIEKYK